MGFHTDVEKCAECQLTSGPASVWWDFCDEHQVVWNKMEFDKLLELG